MLSNRRGSVALVALLAALACRRAGPTAPPSPPPPSSPAPARPLPDRIGPFAAGPATEFGGALRRTYVSGAVQIAVTLARFSMTAEQYADWVRTSTAGFPQASDVVPADVGNGFYQCTETPRPSCDLLVQLRSGVHLEIRGAGTSSRADVDAIARGLGLRAL